MAQLSNREKQKLKTLLETDMDKIEGKLNNVQERLYCLRFFRPLPKGRLCYNTISLKGVSNGETQKVHT